MNWKIHIHFRVRNESICYIVFIDRTKPDNSVRINPATRHSETKYGFVILTGDMIFKDFFLGMKLLLGHEHMASRMESHSLPGRIQVSDAFRSIVQDAFCFDERGIVEIRG